MALTRRATLFLLFVCLCTLSAFSQAGKLRKAENLYKSGKYEQAITHLKKYLEDNVDEKAILLMGMAHYQMADHENALPWLRKSALHSTSLPLDFYLSYGEVLMRNRHFGQAREAFGRYMPVDPTNATARRWAAACDTIIEVLHAEKGWQAELLPINSKYAEFAPVPLSGELLFTSCRSDRSSDSEENEDHSVLDLYSSDMVGPTARLRYFKPRLLTGTLNLQYHESAVTTDSSAKRFAFTRSEFISGADRFHDTGGGKSGIWLAGLDDLGWQDPQEFPFNSPDYSCLHPSMNQEGNMIFFASDMPGGEGGYDLYMSIASDSGWGKPRNLGKSVNTDGDELFPFIHTDGQLWFSSDGHEGMGKLDIYYTSFEDSIWTNVANPGTPFNSQDDDFSMALRPDGQIGWFASNRPGGIGGDDIYSIRKRGALIECRPRQEENYCYTFSDTESKNADEGPYRFKWSMGDGTVLEGPEVRHCFPGPGEYKVVLQIADSVLGTGISETSYHMRLEPVYQALIEGPDTLVVGQEVIFLAGASLPEGFEAVGFRWELGDLIPFPGEEFKLLPAQAGAYELRLKVVATDTSFEKVVKYCTSKIVLISSD